MAPEIPIKKGTEKSVPLKRCEKTVLNNTIKENSKKLKIFNPSIIGIFENPSLKKGNGNGIKFSNTAIKAEKPAKNATNFLSFIIL